VGNTHVKLAVFGHCTIDRIAIESETHDQIGGSGCYCGITARKFGFDVQLVTRFGADFPRQYLDENQITYTGAESSLKTTRFAINVRGAERDLRLDNVCEPIEYMYVDGVDCHIASPICGEITYDTLAKIKKDSGFLLVDPQGFLRARDGHGNITLRDTEIDLDGVDAIKVNVDEAAHLVNSSGDEAMLALQRRGVNNVLLTDGTDISLLNGNRIYSITLPNKQVYDTTGIGDIFCAAFCCTMIKERDFLWALCFAGGAAQAALNSRHVGLQKIPRKGTIQTNASYFYNMIKFRTLATR